MKERLRRNQRVGLLCVLIGGIMLGLPGRRSVVRCLAMMAGQIPMSLSTASGAGQPPNFVANMRTTM